MYSVHQELPWAHFQNFTTFLHFFPNHHGRGHPYLPLMIIMITNTSLCWDSCFFEVVSNMVARIIFLCEGQIIPLFSLLFYFCKLCKDIHGYQLCPLTYIKLVEYHAAHGWINKLFFFYKKVIVIREKNLLPSISEVFELLSCYFLLSHDAR